jgi:hypothetical protein
MDQDDADRLTPELVRQRNESTVDEYLANAANIASEVTHSPRWITYGDNAVLDQPTISCWHWATKPLQSASPTISHHFPGNAISPVMTTS